MVRPALQTRLSAAVATIAATVALMSFPTIPASAHSATTLTLQVVSAAPYVAGEPISVMVTPNAIDYDGTVAFSATPPGPSDAFPADYTFVPPEPSHSFSVTLTKAGSVQLTVTDIADGSLSDTETLVVEPNVPDRLAFGLQPTNTFSHKVMAPITVRIEDEFGNLTPSTANVSVAVNGGTLNAGTTPKAASGGIATFDDLRIDTPNTPPATYTLEATSGSLVPGTSAAFTIIAHADLAVTLTTTPVGTGIDPTIAGTDQTYHVKVTNGGPDMNTSYTVSANIPAGTDFVSSDSGCLGSGPVTCARGPLANGSNETFDITVHIHPDYVGTSSSVPLSFTATLGTTDPTQAPDDASGSNSATVTLAVIARADLSVSSTSTNGSVESDLVYANAEPDDNTATFTFEVSNAGPSDAQGVVLSASLPTPPVDTTNARYCVTTSPATCDPSDPGVSLDPDGETAPILLAAGTTAVFVIELHADPDIEVGETSFTVTAAESSTTPRTDGSANDGTGTSEFATSTVIRVFTRPGPVSSIVAVPGNASAVVSWSPVMNTGGTPVTDYLVTIVPLDGGGIHFVADSGITSNPQLVPGGATLRLAVGDDTHPVLDNPTPSTSFIYQFAVQAVNLVGTSDGVDSNSISPTPHASAEILTNTNGRQTTGTGLVSSGDRVVAQQSGTFTSSGSIGTLVEDFTPPANFCGTNLLCTGNEVVINKLTDPATSRYLVDLIYAKGVATGTGKKIVYFDPTPDTPEGITTLASCPKNLTNATVNANTPACIVKLVNTPAQNPALRVQISINRLLTDPALAVRK